MTRRLTTLCLVSAVAYSLSACGSSSLTPGAGSAATSAAAATTQTADPALVAKLPAKVKAAGKIVVGIDTSYPPNEFLNADGKTANGMDVDLFTAVAQKFGVGVDFQTAGFGTIILGVSGGKYDVGVSSFSINADRKKQVNMVSYYSAGTLWGVPKGNPKKVDPENACGLNIGVQKDTVQVDDLAARSKKCTDAGKPAINPIVEDLQVKVNTDLTSGKVDAMAADSPVTHYAVTQTNGAVEVLGSTYDTAPYGYVVPTSEKDFAAALADALKALDASGEYTKILTKWNIQDGAIHNFSVNP